MAEAGVDTYPTFKPQSTRAVAASKDKNASVPVKEIKDTASWSSERTFLIDSTISLSKSVVVLPHLYSQLTN